MIREVSRTHATIQASRNGRPRMSGVARLTKNGPTMRARNGTTASQRMLRMDEDSRCGENLPPAVVKIYLRRGEIAAGSRLCQHHDLATRLVIFHATMGLHDLVKTKDSA